MSILAGQLAAARCAAGTTQVALATKAGFSRRTITRIEAGAVDPGVDSLLLIKRALGLELLLVNWLRKRSLTLSCQKARVWARALVLGRHSRQSTNC